MQSQSADVFDSTSFQSLDDRLSQIKVSGAVILAISLVCLAVIAVMGQQWFQNKPVFKEHMVTVNGCAAFLGGGLWLATLLYQTHLRKRFIQDGVEWQREEAAKEVSEESHDQRRLPSIKAPSPTTPSNCVTAVTNLRLWAHRNRPHLQNIESILRHCLDPKKAQEKATLDRVAAMAKQSQSRKQVEKPQVIQEGVEEEDREGTIDQIALPSDNGGAPVCLHETIEELLVQHDHLIEWVMENKPFIYDTLVTLLDQALAREVMLKIAFYLEKVDQAKEIMKKYSKVLDQCEALLLALSKQGLDQEQQSHFASRISKLCKLLKQDVFYAFITDRKLWERDDGELLQKVLTLPLQNLLAAFSGVQSAKVVKKSKPENELSKKAKAWEIFTTSKVYADQMHALQTLFALVEQDVTVTRSAYLFNYTLDAIVGGATILGVDSTRYVSQLIYERVWKVLLDEHRYLKDFFERTQFKNECDAIFSHLFFQLFVNRGSGTKQRIALQNIVQEELHLTQTRLNELLHPASLKPVDQMTLGADQELPITQNSPKNPQKLQADEKFERKWRKGGLFSKLHPAAIDEPPCVLSPILLLDQVEKFLERVTRRVRNLYPNEEVTTLKAPNILANSGGYAAFQLVNKKVKKAQYISMTLLALSIIVLSGIAYFPKSFSQIFSPEKVMKIQQAFWFALFFGGSSTLSSLIMQNRLQRKYIDFYMQDYTGYLGEEIDPFLESNREEPLKEVSNPVDAHTRTANFDEKAPENHLVQSKASLGSPAAPNAIVNYLKQKASFFEAWNVWVGENQESIQWWTDTRGVKSFVNALQNFISKSLKFFTQEKDWTTDNKHELGKLVKVVFGQDVQLFHRSRKAIASIVVKVFPQLIRSADSGENVQATVKQELSKLSTCFMPYAALGKESNKIESLAAILGGENWKKEAKGTVGYLTIIQKWLEIYEALVDQIAGLILDLPLESSLRLQDMEYEESRISQKVDLTTHATNQETLKTTVKNLQSTLTNQHLFALLTTPILWLEVLDALFENELLENNFYLYLLGCGKSDAEIVQILKDLPNNKPTQEGKKRKKKEIKTAHIVEGRLIAMAEYLYDAKKNVPCEKNILIEYVPYTEAFRSRVHCQENTKNRMDAMRLALQESEASFVNKVITFFANNGVAAAQKFSMTPKIKEQIIKKIRDIFSKCVKNPFFVQFNLQVENLVTCLYTALVEIPGDHRQYRENFDTILRRQLLISGTVLQSFTEATHSSSENIYLIPFRAFLDSLVNEVRASKSNPNSKEITSKFKPKGTTRSPLLPNMSKLLKKKDNKSRESKS